ncbi:MAG: hypothetical protein GXO39_04755 [Thermotogae bacterium]|nr:hypothetical protein [Thermotogota bacterium]
MKKKGQKILSPRTVPERLNVRIPKHLYEWLKEKAEKERKSLSLVLTEILEREFKKEKQETRD